MMLTLKNATFGILLGFMVPALLAAQESPREFYSAPIGLTRADVLRVVIAPAPLRFHHTPNQCQARITVEILDALDATVLASEGPAIISIGNSFLMDFEAEIGSPPEREEVLVRTTIEKRSGKKVGSGARRTLCSLVGSLQVYDVMSGRTTFHERDYDGTFFAPCSEEVVCNW